MQELALEIDALANYLKYMRIALDKELIEINKNETLRMIHNSCLGK